jgi:hypothetical protein
MRLTRALTSATSVALALAALLAAPQTSLAQAALPPADIAVSDQKAGSVLVFPFYTSSPDGGNDTNITISHVGSAAVAAPAWSSYSYVHLYFVDGSSCGQADALLALTPNGSISFNASEWDPGVTGYIIAVAVNPETFVPTANNVLVGNAFVKVGPDARPGSIRGNYGAEAFRKKTPGDAEVSSGAAVISFGGAYDRLPNTFVAEIKSPLDVPGQQLVVASVAGDLAGGRLAPLAQNGVGYLTNADEKVLSFSGFLPAGCLLRATVTESSPRAPGGVAALLPRGYYGTVKFAVRAADTSVSGAGGVGLVITPVNASGYHSIRTLHKMRDTGATLRVPVF